MNQQKYSGQTVSFGQMNKFQWDVSEQYMKSAQHGFAKEPSLDQAKGNQSFQIIINVIINCSRY